ncbi:Lrp/AsnC family transcriptional regulator [Desulfocucumis palustris]|uniref:Lrp/AsnC family transcriptional regulator n=1 Tax=Desulfocucumis palustris TaxID=1898651 RepID=UPI0022B09D9B|nr:Lrp/AsnC family transcriptional regulator [Desulfocucumis palustris]
MDSTDLNILRYLKKDGRAQWKEIGAAVHLTGQAVADRVHRMEDLGIIKGFTVDVDEGSLGLQITALITVCMKTAEHHVLHNFIRDRPEIREAHRISGDGCYWLKAVFQTNEQLSRFLDRLLNYGNYRISLSIDTIK